NRTNAERLLSATLACGAASTVLSLDLADQCVLGNLPSRSTSAKVRAVKTKATIGFVGPAMAVLAVAFILPLVGLLLLSILSADLSDLNWSSIRARATLAEYRTII